MLGLGVFSSSFFLVSIGGLNFFTFGFGVGGIVVVVVVAVVFEVVSFGLRYFSIA